MTELQQIELGLIKQRAGDWVGAKEIYNEVLSTNPRSADAHHMLGVIAIEEGILDSAEAHIRYALSISPASPICLTNLALVYERKGDIHGAIEMLNEVIALSDSYLPALRNLGALLVRVGDFVSARRIFEKILTIDAQDYAAILQLANCMLSLKQYEAAIQQYETFLLFQPNHISALSNAGLACHRNGQFEQAIAFQNRALAINPNHLPALVLKGSHLSQLGRNQEALVCLNVAEALDPNFPSIQYNIGTVLVSLDQLDEAKLYLEAASRRSPRSVEVLYNLGICLFERSELPQAIDRYNQALIIDPTSAEVRWNRSLALLLLGRYEEGFQAYEARWERVTQRAHRSYGVPRWDGEESLEGHRILVHSEQGFGDSIQFVRFLEHLKAAGASTIFEGPPTLLRLFEALPFVDEVIATGAPVIEADFHIPMMSLPLALRIFDPKKFGKTPYLNADRALVAKWSLKLADLPAGARIGISWSGSRDHPRDRHRSIPLDQFMHAFSHDKAVFIALQKDLRREDVTALKAHNIRDYRHDLTDFAETAALISCLDLVITVDTSVAHLAGALGKQTLLLLGKVPDWRWLDQGQSIPWYAKMEVFRQTRRLDWQSPLLAATTALQNFISSQTISCASVQVAQPSYESHLAESAPRLDTKGNQPC